MARQQKSVTVTHKKKRVVVNEDTLTVSRQNRNVRTVQNSSAGQLISVLPKTEPQRQMIESWSSGLNIAAIGSAGTGKTFLALHLALGELERGTYKKILILRSAVSTRDIGFLPGTATEKLEPYEAPYKYAVNFLLGSGTAYEILKKKGIINFDCTSFLRGITIDDTIVIVDEAQSMNLHEADTIITRLSNSSRLFICGDTKQNDLLFNNKDTTGLPEVIRRLNMIPKYFDVVRFMPQDIVRGGLCRAWILSGED